MRDMVPRLSSEGVAHTLIVEGGAHGNVGVVRGGGQDIVHTPHRRNDILHNMKCVPVFYPLCLVVFMVVDYVFGDT